MPPFLDESFSCAIAILILHHFRSQELQDARSRKCAAYCSRAEYLWRLKFTMAGCNG